MCSQNFRVLQLLMLRQGHICRIQSGKCKEKEHIITFHALHIVDSLVVPVPLPSKLRPSPLSPALSTRLVTSSNYWL